MTPAPLCCPDCESSLTQAHCQNPQCDWITCTSCRKVSRIVAV